MNTHPQNDQPWADHRVTAYVLGELEPERTAEFEQEMLSSPALAAAVEEARGITAQLKSWFADEPPMTLDADRREAVLGCMANQGTQDLVGQASASRPPASPSRAGRGSATALRWFALVASLLLALGAVGYQLIASSDANRRQQVVLAQSGPTGDVSPSRPATEQLAATGQATAAEEPKRRSLRESVVGEEMEETETLGLNEQDGESAMFLNYKKLAEAAAEPFERSELSQPTAPVDHAAAAADELGIADASSASASQRVSEPQRVSELSLQGGAEVRLQRESQSRFAANPPLLTPSEGAPLGGMSGGMGGRTDLGVELDGAVAEDFGDIAQAGRASIQRRGRPAMDRDEYGSMEPELVINDPQPRPSLGTSGLSILRKETWDAERHLEDEGRGPGMAGDRFDAIMENPFKRVDEHPLSTFSIDVDTAAYAKVRQYLKESGRLPRPDVVRIEELVNYFEYDYPGPPADGPHPLAADIEIAECPWNTKHRLARIAVQAKQISAVDRPPCNLVFLIDTSGSMNVPNRLPLVQHGLEMLLDKLNQSDRVAMVVYAGSAGLVLDSTPASDVSRIRRALTRLQAGGSTNGGDGIRLAYQTARDHFIPAGINRVVLCTDGDFNVGTTSQDELIRLVQEQARGGIDLTVLGFGMGNHNDAMLEQISGRGNGNYAFIDNPQEARRVLVQRATSTRFTIARDVKIQVEFNPSQVSAFRLIGYENRMLAKEDFNDDTKDAGEVGAGHSVTVLYELIPHDGDTHVLPPVVDELKYQRSLSATEAADGDEVMTVKVRYKPIEQADDAKVGVPGGGGDAQSIGVEFTASDSGQKFSQASDDYRFAALVAAFGLQLRGSEHRGSWTLSDVLREAIVLGGDQDESRAEWIELVRRAAALQTGETGR